ncbi:hypothetical protein M569_10749, partial [Genlisea aurea]
MLGICGDINSILDRTCTGKLRHLSELKLMSEKVTGCHLRREFFPPELKSLTLSGTQLQWKDMKTLGNALRKLETLKLKEHAFVGDAWQIDDGEGFDSLKWLLIKRCDLQRWTVVGGSFGKLSHLVIENCSKLGSIPVFENLQVLELETVTPETVASAKIMEGRIRGLVLKISLSDLPPGHGENRIVHDRLRLQALHGKLQFCGEFLEKSSFAQVRAFEAIIRDSAYELQDAMELYISSYFLPNHEHELRRDRSEKFQKQLERMIEVADSIESAMEEESESQ